MPDQDDELDGFEKEEEESEEETEDDQADGKKEDGLEGFEEAEKGADAKEKQDDKELAGFEEAEATPSAGARPGAALAAAAATGAAAGSQTPDVYTETEEVAEQGFGEKMKNSVAGMFIGFVLFVASFFILYKGETRVDRSKIVKGAVAIQPDNPAGAPKGAAVKFTGKAATSAPVTDNEYAPTGRFIYLARKAEMYAWVEESETKTSSGEKAGKKTQTRTTTYRYMKQWTDNPPDSSDFKHPEGHTNPPMTVESKTWAAKPVTVGALKIDLTEARVLGAEELSEPESKALAPAPFDPNAPIGQGPVRFESAPTAQKPAETEFLKDKKLLLYTIRKETYGQDGTWAPGATTVKTADGITVGQVKINTEGLKAVDLPEPGKMLYKPKSAATKPEAGNERAIVQGIEMGSKVALSGTFGDGTLSEVTISGRVAPETSAPPVPKGPWYIGKGSLSAPEVGDIRLTFTGIRPDAELFVCGEVQGESVAPTMYKGVAFMVAAQMTENRVIAQLQSEHKMWTWVARIAGFLCMWVGMCMMTGPLTFLLGYIPVLGGLAAGLLSVVFGVVALLLTVLTIVLVRFFWIILILAVVAVVWGISKAMQKKAAPAGGKVE